MITPDDIKKHSPSEFLGRNHVIYQGVNLKGNLSLFELRETLVALALNHYLSIKYIWKNYGSNSADAISELNNARASEKRVFICNNNQACSTIEAFWHINEDLTEEELQKYIRPGISKMEKPAIRRISTVVKQPKKWVSKKRKPQPKDPRGESNRIATRRPKESYDTVTGGGAPKVGPEDKSNTGWSENTSLQFRDDIKSGKLLKRDDP